MKAKRVKQDNVQDDTPRTTIRADVTQDEHTVIRRTAKNGYGMNISEFVRLSVDAQLKAATGKTLAELTEAEARHGHLVQEELF